MPKTIKMANDAGELVEANPSQIISKGGHGKHFYDMTEVEPICSIADSFGSVVIDYSGSPSFYNARADSDEPGVAIRAVYWPLVNGANVFGVDTAWQAPLGKDAAITVCAKSRVATPGVTRPAVSNSCGDGNGNGRPAFTTDLEGYGGCVSVYIGDAFSATDSQIKMHPYYAVFVNDVLNDPDVNVGQLATPFYDPMKKRVDGEIYIVTAVKRGYFLEHYVNGMYTGSADIREKNSAMQAAWSNLSFGRYFRWGHSAFGTPAATLGSFNPLPENPPGSSAIAELEQDFYGLSISHFDAAPPQNIIKLGHAWMKREWPKGNKKVYPGWVQYS